MERAVFTDGPDRPFVLSAADDRSQPKANTLPTGYARRPHMQFGRGVVVLRGVRQGLLSGNSLRLRQSRLLRNGQSDEAFPSSQSVLQRRLSFKMLFQACNHRVHQRLVVRKILWRRMQRSL